MICYKPHSGSKIANNFELVGVIDKYYVTKRFKMMMFFNCCVRMQVYSIEGSSQSNLNEMFEPLTHSLHGMRADLKSNFD